VLNNIRKIGFDAAKMEMREEAKLFHLCSSIATQGFELIDIRCDGERAEATVRDLTTMLAKDRMIHASQFVCPIWANYPHQSVTVNYLNSRGELLLTATAKGEDCKAVVDDGEPFETLAGRVQFVLTVAGKAAMV
jgi:hypothetical protein